MKYDIFFVVCLRKSAGRLIKAVRGQRPGVRAAQSPEYPRSATKSSVARSATRDSGNPRHGRKFSDLRSGLLKVRAAQSPEYPRSATKSSVARSATQGSGLTVGKADRLHVGAIIIR